ncbi:MAG: hypothetical protein J4N87_02705 [Chloroflexi bacterium]|nr:hypothetical protein [Chloroflexota bacterium]
MAEQTGVQEVTAQEQKQDCGCGCGGDLSAAAKNDCGCGCGGDSCGSTQQELVLVNAAQIAEIRQQAAR